MTAGRKPLQADLVVGANIRKLRGEHGLTLQEFSSQLGMSHQQLQKYETGSNRVSAGVLYVMARAFSVPVDALFEGVDDTTGSDETTKTLQLARNKCHTIIDRVSSVAVLTSMAKVLRAMQDTD
ncbi:MAG TPA: helix-turn-helix transcriptional regulator [Hyphomonas sp.]|nr:XRE family transcriptional regulator [Hyphomonas sp.]HRI99195.1 helix-turn-helix transcriptional regulator [Hyphomonas sp.]HRK68155.1 helix-turn-helix transcriptional regulator [Hyphomonas sp.]